MANKIHLIIFFILYSLDLSLYCEPLTVGENGTMPIMSKQMVCVGVILDLDSPVGKMAQSYISKALSDFYATNANYQTKLNLTVKDAQNDVVAAASAALDLMKNERVQAIIGPQSSSQAKFLINLGEKAQIPIISFSATSPSLSQTQSQFFVRTSLNDSSQVQAIKCIVKAYGWHEVVLIYEDTEYGNGLIPYITDAFQQIDTKVPYRSVISPSSNPFQILKELNKLMAMETRVFLVHMNASRGAQLFGLAKEAGMMSKGSAWIITSGLSTLLHPEGNVIDPMEGVVGVRPYVPKSKALDDFKMRWKMSNPEINLFGLWAYDTVWALAEAVESVGQVNSSALQQQKINTGGHELLGLSVSNSGSSLVKALQGSKFEGLSGEFKLIGGQLQPAAFEIINVLRNKGETVIGYWTPNKKTFDNLVKSGKLSANSSTSNFRIVDKNHDESFIIRKEPPIRWPGRTSTAPRGWVVPVTADNKFRVGVPVTYDEFNEFMKIEWDHHTNKSKSFSGFSYDVFIAAKKRMPFDIPCKFIPFRNGSSREPAGTYDELLLQIEKNVFDAVVGDTTIIANRTAYVDFTLPYSESGVRMVVKVKDAERKNMWIFLKPLSWDLWLTTGVAFIFTGVVVWVLEHRQNTEFRGSRKQQLGTILWFSFSTLVFAHKEKVVNNWTRFVVIMWIFVVLILTQSYTASLASMLTVERLQPAVVDVNELRRNGDYVGYHKDSFVRELLTTQLNFDEKMLKNYTSPKEYHEALSSGSKNGGVDAIFDEIPYIKLFMSQYCSRYRVVGPTYKTDGFGFAFRLGSPIVAHMSRAILNVTQDYEEMEKLQRKYFLHETKCQDSSSTFPSESPSLSVYSFGGLFIITAAVSVSSCLIYILHFLYKHWPALNSIHPEASLLSKMERMAKHFDRKDGGYVLGFEQSQATHGNASPMTNARGDELLHMMVGTTC